MSNEPSGISGELEDRMSDLKPCPFCGGRAYVRRKYDLWQIGCSEPICGFTAEGWASEEGALTAWNTRPTPAPAACKDSLQTDPAPKRYAVLRADPYKLELCEVVRRDQSRTLFVGTENACRDWIAYEAPLDPAPVGEQAAGDADREHLRKMLFVMTAPKTTWPATLIEAWIDDAIVPLAAARAEIKRLDALWRETAEGSEELFAHTLKQDTLIAQLMGALREQRQIALNNACLFQVENIDEALTLAERHGKEGEK